MGCWGIVALKMVLRVKDFELLQFSILMEESAPIQSTES